jgi:hypothetical protein
MSRFFSSSEKKFRRNQKLLDYRIECNEILFKKQIKDIYIALDFDFIF